MPVDVTEVDELQRYIAGVMGNAEHHAGPVRDIALAIAGAVVWRKAGPLRVYTRQNSMTNASWFNIGPRRFALSYNHEVQTIEVRADSMQGERLASFTNATPLSEVTEFFEAL